MVKTLVLVFITVGVASADILVEGGPRGRPPFYVPESRAYTVSLYLDNAYHSAGEWGPVEFCPDQSFVNAFEVKYQQPDNLDETAINMVKLYCQEGMVDMGYITSTYGDKGSDLGSKSCTEGPANGFTAQVLEYQGILTDDVAVHEMILICNSTEQVASGIVYDGSRGVEDPGDGSRGYQLGTWSTIRECPTDNYVCGIQTRFEDASLGDETAVCDIVLLCCNLF